MFRIKSTKQSLFSRNEKCTSICEMACFGPFQKRRNHYFLTHRNKQTFCPSSTSEKIMSSSYFQMMVIVLSWLSLFIARWFALLEKCCQKIAILFRYHHFLQNEISFVYLHILTIFHIFSTRCSTIAEQKYRSLSI